MNLYPFFNVFFFKFQGEALLQRGLVILDKVVEMKVESFQISPEQIQLYVEMQHKMRRTR